MAKAAITLKPEREKSLKRHHPWIFSNAIQSTTGRLKSGSRVDVLDHQGNWLAYAAWSPESQIRARIWSFNPDEIIDARLLKSRIQRAQALREQEIAAKGLTGYRLVAAESDLMPGLIIDRYADILVLQILSAGMEAMREQLVAVLRQCYPDCRLYERSDVDVRKKEGLEPRKGPIYGDFSSTQVVIEENGIRIAVDVAEGHKTGFYLDQRDNRAAAGRLAKDASVLNCFSYTGTFSLYCLKGGAKEVVNVDASQTALDLAANNLNINGLENANCQQIKADVFALLRKYQEQGKQFDMVILDPPKFADNKAQLKGACRGYKDINLQAMKLVRPGGTLLTFSCSGLMEGDLFQKIVADAALDAGRDVRFVERLSQGWDHPIASHFPEGFYLKGLVAKVY